MDKGEFTGITNYLALQWFLAVNNSFCIYFCIKKQSLENLYCKIYQFQSSIHPLNSSCYG